MTKLYNTIGHEIKEIAQLKEISFNNEVNKIDRIFQKKQNALLRAYRIIDVIAQRYPEILKEVID